MTIAESSIGRISDAVRPARGTVFLALTGLLLLSAILSLAIGPTGVSLQSLPRAFAAAAGYANDASAERDRLVLIDIRLPRTLLAAFVGAALATSGAMMQGLFRNPLADPGLIGVSSGAALAAIATIVLGHGIAAPLIAPFGIYALPIAAFFGGLVTTLTLVAIASRRGELAVGTLLLAGIAIGALSGSLGGYISYASDDRELRDLTLWSMGSLSGASWQKVLAVLPFAVAILLVVPRLMRGLNGFLLGEAEAMHLGIDIERTKRLAIATTAAAVGAAVAVAGVIGFVGLVAPHVMRLISGPDHRAVLPGSAILGAILVIVADIIARMAIRPAELPIGIVLALVGAPVFLHLVLRRNISGGG
ncbi:iron chelate uptake ABC transporter family permease subunit [Hyphomicrobium sp.]|uniref:FecCD family ABC transporter permease n=1 Tax=Hyphomicrobium sp. TaxID=82 RepID=UPI000FA4C8F1|nr:iron chelate uptake ABC transporter family permease subunit [Hyphomicrobium sp.]MBN9246361.1 iron chelate uptake ABC transporter family permease subunit [Hyphomicrobium sp.]RUP08498.1 MAG: iron ABC transporter [Hyphomicrobium sp.]